MKLHQLVKALIVVCVLPISYMCAGGLDRAPLPLPELPAELPPDTPTVIGDGCFAFLRTTCGELFGAGVSCGSECKNVWIRDGNGDLVEVAVCKSLVTEAQAIWKDSVVQGTAGDGDLPNMQLLNATEGRDYLGDVRCGISGACACSFEAALGRDICSVKEWNPIDVPSYNPRTDDPCLLWGYDDGF